MEQRSVNAVANRVSDRRAQMLPFMASLFIAQQALYFLGFGAGTGDRQIHNVLLVSWVTLSAIMLLVLTTGGAWFQPRAVRRLANDEVTRVHRNAALSAGFIASMIACMAVYVVSLTEAVQGLGAAHLVMSVGIASALLRLAFLERRATQNG